MARVDFDFSAKTVVITGASRGIGLGVAAGFARAGARLHILSDTEFAIDGVDAFSDTDKKAVSSYVCDITDRNRVKEIIGALDTIDVLINNAGLERPTPLLDEDAAVEETFRRVIEINIMGTYYVSREAAQKMKPGSKMIFTSSIWGQTAVPEFSAYCASKHANIGFMRALAQELGPKGINVNAVCPGWVKTEAAMHSLGRMAAEAGRDEQELLGEIMSAQAIGGLMEPEDMIGAYLFLASDAASNITGQTLNVDRGELMG